MCNSIIRSVTAVFAIAVFGGVAIGCGDEDHALSEKQANTVESTGDIGDQSKGTDGRDVSPGTEWVVSCRKGVRDSPVLSDDARVRIVELCEQARSGDGGDVRRSIVEQVCVEIVKESVATGAPGRDRSLAACKQRSAEAGDNGDKSTERAPSAHGDVVPTDDTDVVGWCKQGVDSSPNASQKVKDDLKRICEKAGTGDEADVRNVITGVCRRMIEATISPEAPGRAQALANC